MTDTPKTVPAKPILLVVSIAADSVRAWGQISFIDPDHDKPRLYNVEAIAVVTPAHVFPACSQEHWDGGEPYLAEAERITAAFLRATFPYRAKKKDQP